MLLFDASRAAALAQPVVQFLQLFEKKAHLGGTRQFRRGFGGHGSECWLLSSMLTGIRPKWGMLQRLLRKTDTSPFSGLEPATC
jgi:hypothetical protein